MPPTATREGCRVCRSPHATEIDRKIRSGQPIVSVVRWLREVDDPFSRLTLSRHTKICAGRLLTKGKKPVPADFLRAVVDRAAEGLESGALTPTLRDGIAAQSQLDRRVEKTAEMRLALIMAQVLGAGITIEGEAKELTSGQP